MSNSTEKIAIIGIGAIFPRSLNAAEYWDNILKGKDSIIEVPLDRWDWRLYWDADPKAPDKTYSKIGGFVQGFKFDSLKYRIPPTMASQMDPVQHMVITVADEAIRDAVGDV